MLRVGLTGELGSGKSTVARLLAGMGAHVFSSDETGRALMQPGQPVFAAILAHFGPAVLAADGTLDRPALAALAFNPDHPRIDELNAIVHPAVLAEQGRQLGALAETDPGAIAVVESALLFTTPHGGDRPWCTRFDRILLVTAPDDLKLARFVERTAGGRDVTPDLTPAQRQAIRTDGERRLAQGRIPAHLAATCLVIPNTGDLAALQHRTEDVFRQLRRAAKETVPRSG